MINIMVPTKPDWIGLVFCQLETNPVTMSLFNYHHGTGPIMLGMTLKLQGMYIEHAAQSPVKSLIEVCIGFTGSRGQ